MTNGFYHEESRPVLAVDGLLADVGKLLDFAEEYGTRGDGFSVKDACDIALRLYAISAVGCDCEDGEDA